MVQILNRVFDRTVLPVTKEKNFKRYHFIRRLSKSGKAVQKRDFLGQRPAGKPVTSLAKS